MLLFGNSGRHVTLKVHARSWLPLQRINILSDAGANCSIFGCGMSRKPKYEGIGIFKIPPSQGKKKKQQQQQQQQQQKKNKESWRKASLHVVTRDRVVDPSFRKQIEEGSVYVCERHFTPEDIEIRKFQSFSYLFLY